ncbi:restriction endonuclease subunit S [Nesterenkonia sp. CL21]|uniref:restriction endonuclease subunit S n=1 Tax=Nesterenkonia sp. CL21 TaxID=3064894 RepID=UPI002879826B|nr:restriction endonuclease subunit S [Nesterenkonia sp. CL21]MDS2171342.1 restriction endonuclease subunit S [Nesterenkonia sp. CL21]
MSQTTDQWHEASLAEAASPDAPIGYGIVQVGPYDRDGVPVLAIRDLLSPSEHSLHRSSRKIEAQYRRSRVRGGDVLISVKGTTGRVGIVPAGFAGNISRDVARVRLRDEHDPRYWLHLLRSEHAQQTLQIAAVGTTRQELSIRTLKTLRFLYPDKAEQARIAGVLSDVDGLIATLERIIAKKQAIKQGMMQQLLTGETRLPGFTEPWSERSLGDVARIKTGSRNNQDKKASGRYPFFVRSATVERIDSYSYDCEAILVPGEGGIGSIYHYINGKFEVHQRVYKISDFALDASGRFVYHFMHQYFGLHAMENSVKATVDSLRLPTFKNFELQLPSLDEQQAIVDALDDAEAELTLLQGRLEKARGIKTGMMQELLTGRTRLAVAEGAA